MNLTQAYQARVLRDNLEPSSRQLEVLEIFEHLSKFLAYPSKTSWFRKKKITPGIYLHGPVGSGKTFLMDLFFENLSISRKLRLHFLHWMQQIDTQLRQFQGEQDPLRLIAENMAQSVAVICIDEFMVHDPSQAMILLQLLELLFKRGVVLVATSNTRPDDLYPNGIQRDRFLKAIALIKSHCSVMSLDAGRDYRLAHDVQMATCLTPMNDMNQHELMLQFQKIAPEALQSGVLMIQNRLIPFIRCADTAVWFDFHIICQMPRSQLDYLEIAARFNTVFISGVPIFHEGDIVPAILFIHLVDVLYDNRIRLVMTAEAPVEKLMLACESELPIERTSSRLVEMQSWNYVVNRF